jgi:putative nucleotidyltransferase with HDIG domain
VSVNKNKLRLARIRAQDEFEHYIKAAERAFFGMSEQHGSFLSVKRAIETLVEKIILDVDAETRCSFEIISNVEYGNRFVSHSVKCMMISVIIGRCIPLPEPKLVSVATGALLHDIGKVLKKNAEFKSLVPNVNISETTDVQPEHPIISRDITEFLGFNDEIVQTVWSHHRQSTAPGAAKKRQKETMSILDKVVATANFAENLLAQLDYPGSDQFFSSLFQAFKSYPKMFDTAIQMAFRVFFERPPISRRRRERARVNVSTYYSAAEKSTSSYPAGIMDISSFGLRIRCKEVLAVGMNLILSFTIGHGMSYVGVSCKVIWREVDGVEYLYGVEFRDKNVEMAQKLDEYVHRCRRERSPLSPSSR